MFYLVFFPIGLLFFLPAFSTQANASLPPPIPLSPLPSLAAGPARRPCRQPLLPSVLLGQHSPHFPPSSAAGFAGLAAPALLFSLPPRTASVTSLRSLGGIPFPPFGADGLTTGPRPAPGVSVAVSAPSAALFSSLTAPVPPPLFSSCSAPPTFTSLPLTFPNTQMFVPQHLQPAAGLHVPLALTAAGPASRPR